MQNLSEDLFSIHFRKNELPQPDESREKTDDKPVRYGTSVHYPNFLLDLYGSSPIHQSIINSKATYIQGEGLGLSGKKLELKVNDADTIQDFVSKVVKDYLIFNYFAVEVVYNPLKQPIQYFHVPAQKIRTNRSKTKFWYSADNWTTQKHDYTLDRWKPTLGPNDEPTTRLFFFDGYFPSTTNVYPAPEYKGSIESIQTDKLIRQFHLNVVDNQFSISTLVELFGKANLPDDVKRQFVRDLEAMYTGASGKRIMVSFEDLQTQGGGSRITNIDPGNWDKAYEAIGRNVADDIYRGHSVTSPMLFGVKTEGQLGGATELETAYEIFKNTFVREKRNDLQAAFNMLFTNSAIVKGKVDFIDKPLFQHKLSDAIKEKVMTTNELRAEAGLPPLPDGDRIQKPDVAEVQPAQQPFAIYYSTEERVSLREEDFEKVMHLGNMREDFEVIEEGEFVFSKEHARNVQLQFEDSQEIGRYILDNGIDGLTLAELKSRIRKDLGISITADELRSTLNSLTSAGVINVTIEEGTVRSRPVTKQKPSQPVELMYAYETRPGYGEDILPTSRAFCVRLMKNNRLYSRADIQSMSAIFGYDIFQYGGGFYKKPDGSVSPHCRHFFRAYTVVRRNK